MDHTTAAGPEDMHWQELGERTWPRIWRVLNLGAKNKVSKEKSVAVGALTHDPGLNVPQRTCGQPKSAAGLGWRELMTYRK